MHIKRPWGEMWKLVHTRRFWLKIICVTGRTSLQTHSERTEYHISGKGFRKVRPGEKHRLTSGWYLELAIGKPRENDIVRYEDDYGRS